MTNKSGNLLADQILAAAHPLTGSSLEYDPLLDRIGKARIVLIGEASHGTHEFYHHRAQITKRLIREKGFRAVAVEADWPDAYQINRYVRGAGDGKTALESLEGFKRFPTWMWRNADVLDFIGWLRASNDSQPKDQQAGFYGLDLYSLYTSAQAVLTYLDKVDPEAAQRARYRYACFEQFGEDTQAYGYAASFGMSGSCENEVVNQLFDLQRSAGKYQSMDGQLAADEQFFAEQNARLVRNAEEYYRTMFSGRVSSWNLRDEHMVETLTALDAHLSRSGTPAKIVVWEHNSHLGDARATEMGEQGELNVGQLVREKYGNEAVSVGFSTYSGTVTAASNWDEPAERKRVRAALPNSYEALFHDVRMSAFLLLLSGDQINEKMIAALRQPRLQRAIGVVYRPDTERISHYFHARLPDQFDAIIHIDETRAVEPLERTPQWISGEAPETFPTGV